MVDTLTLFTYLSFGIVHNVRVGSYASAWHDACSVRRAAVIRHAAKACVMLV